MLDARSTFLPGMIFNIHPNFFCHCTGRFKKFFNSKKHNKYCKVYTLEAENIFIEILRNLNKSFRPLPLNTKKYLRKFFFQGRASKISFWRAKIWVLGWWCIVSHMAYTVPNLICHYQYVNSKITLPPARRGGRSLKNRI